MKVLQTTQSRQEYIEAQIARSDRKFGFSKVSVGDVAKYRSIVLRDMTVRGDPADVGPILCIGTRNGREVDLFRMQFFGTKWPRSLSALLERQTHSFVSWCSRLESIGRSSVEDLSSASAVGVEINPRAARPDIWIGSFDEMPRSWEGRFGLMFSNSFDHSQDPQRTAREWRRVARPGGYLIFCFAKDTPPTITDPVGDLCLRDVTDLFGAELVYFHDRGSRSRYSEAIVRIE